MEKEGLRCGLRIAGDSELEGDRKENRRKEKPEHAVSIVICVE
jgi:hypothetical protein